jgi:transposase-like protein
MPKPDRSLTPPTTTSPLEVTSTEVRPPNRRRTFSAKDKLRIVRAAEKCKDRGEVGALLRQEGIYHSMLGRWRTQLAELGEAGLAKSRGRKSSMTPEQRELDQMRRAAERQQAEIGRLREMLELQKKVLALVDAAQKLVS